MNLFGFVLDTGPSVPVPTGDPVAISTATVPIRDEKEIFLERFGLLPAQIATNGGQQAADNFTFILTNVEDESMALENRTALSQGLLAWHRSAPDYQKEAALNRAYYKIIEISRFILVDPDGANLTITAQLIARDLASILLRQVQEDRTFQGRIYKDLLKALQYVVDRQIVLIETPGSDDAPSLRCEALRLFMKCLPTEGELP